MKDYFKVLKVDKSADLSEIKDAYRKLAMEHHPDKGGDADRFKEIAEAYEWLCNHKRENRQRSEFKDFGDFGDFFKDGKKEFYSKKQKTQSTFSTDHLNIHISKKITLAEAVLGVKINCKYDKLKIIAPDFNSGGRVIKEKEEKEIIINLNLTKKWINVELLENEYLIRVTLPALGNEDYIRYINAFDEVEPNHLMGDLIVDITMPIERDIELLNGDIIHKIQVPLYKILKGGEKIRIETIFNKKYDAEISQPVLLNGLKLVIAEQGTLKSDGKTGDYIIQFEVLCPTVNKLKKSERDQFLNLLKDI